MPSVWDYNEQGIWDYSKQAVYENLLPTIDNCEYNLETVCSQ